MIRYTTFKLNNKISSEPIFSLAHVNTSDSILSQTYKDVPCITDNFIAIPVQTVKHSRLSIEDHAVEVLCQITKSDYELISFKKKQLDDKLSDKASFPF